MRGTVAVRGLQLVADVPVWGERQALFRDFLTADVATQPLQFLAFIRSLATPACSENPATLPTPSSKGSSHAGSLCMVDTLRVKSDAVRDQGIQEMIHRPRFPGLSSQTAVFGNCSLL